VHDGLIQAALELFIDRGFDATTIDDVAARADVSRRTFFRYFQSKEDCVLAWADQICAEILRGLEQRPAREPPWLAFRAVAVEVLAVYQRDRDHFYPLESLIATTPTIRAARRGRMGLFADAVAHAFARRMGLDVRRHVLPRAIAHAANGVLTASVDTWLARGGKGSLVKLIDEAFGAFEIS